MKKLFYTLILIGFFQHIEAQSIKENRLYDTLVHVFKLDRAQTYYVISHSGIQDTNILFTHLYKEYDRKTYKDDTLPSGNYISTIITDDNVAYKFIQINPIAIKSKVIGDDVVLFLNLKKDKSVLNSAKVEVGGKEAKYDDGYGGYVFRQKDIDPESYKKGKVFIAISYQGETYFEQYKYEKAYSSDNSQNYNSGIYNFPSPGYFITDKPLYKPLDTLRLKAFLVNLKNGRPIRKRSTISISESNQNFFYSKRIKSKSPGSYVFNWKIPDTLKMDRTYQLKIQYDKHTYTYYKNSSFYLEDYVLNKNTYNVQMARDIYFAGDDIAFFVSAKDANGFPIPNTMIHYNLRIVEINHLLTDSLRISSEQYASWYSKDTTIDYENFIELKIPSTILPKANARYVIDVTIVDPITFERKVISQTFTKLVEKEKLVVYQNLDSFHVHTLYNLKDTQRTFRFITLSNSDTLTNKIIKTPYHYKLSPSETVAILIDKDSTITTTPILFNQLEITEIKGKRKHDSILISFKYPFDEPVHYKIFQENKLVKSGKSSKLDFKLHDDSKSKYTILFTTNLKRNIESNFYKITYVPQNKIIQLKTSMKEQAFPGETIPISIVATDFKNKALNKINIASYAINSMFENKIQTPQIDIPLKYQNQIEIKQEDTKNKINLYLDGHTGTFLITKNHISKYNLLRNEAYKIKYPEKGYAVVNFSKQESKPEFSVVISHKTKLMSPKYVKEDGELRFISDINKQGIYSIPTTEGKHKIEFRYFDRKYTIPEITFSNNKKYIISINLDSITKSNNLITVSDSLNPFEPTIEERELLYNSVLITNVFYYDTLELKSNEASVEKYYQNYVRPATLNIDGDNFFVLGPLSPNKQQSLKVNDKEFSLKKSTQFANYYDQVMQSFETKKLGEIKGIFLSFGEFPLNINQIINLKTKDTLVPIPETAQLIFNKKAFEAQQEEKAINYYQSYNSGKGTGQFTIQLENNIDSIYVSSLWLIHHTNSEECTYINSVGRSPSTTFRKAGSEALYDIYLLINKSRLCVLRNVYFNTNDKLIINPSYLKTEPLENEKLEQALKIYTELTRVPTLPFYFPPEIKLKGIKEKPNPNRKNVYVHGVITDESLSPISEALVMLEINGQFRHGAITNQNGEFELLDIPAASYQVKIYHADYQIIHYDAKLFEKKHDYELSVSMKESEIQRPIFETINNDFRFMTFIKNEQKNMLKMMFYDYETREPIENVQIKITKNTGTFINATLNSKTQTETIFPKDKESVYSIEISKQGYIPLKLNGLEYNEGYFYELQSFLHPDITSTQHKKEYNIYMQNQLPQLEMEEEPKVSTFSNSSSLVSTTNIKNVAEIYGRITDDLGQALDFATVVAIQGGITKGGAKTDLQGNYKIKPLNPGIYTIRITYSGYRTEEIQGIVVSAERRVEVNVKLEKNVNNLKEIKVTSYKVPLIKKDGNNAIISKAQIEHNGTSNIGDVVGLKAGVYQRKAGVYSYNFDGDATSSAMFTIDGPSYSYSRSTRESGSVTPKYANSNLLDQAMDNSEISTTRKEFSDVGYWKPNLITNKKGIVNFSIKLPDNITTWRAYVLAMGKSWLHGIDTAQIQVYKPLQTMSMIPRFLYDQDKVYAKARFVNLMKDSVTATTSISLNDKTITSKISTIRQQVLDSVLITPSSLQPIVWKAGLVYKERYKDFEEISIPVFSSAMKFHTNQSIQMEEDSIYKMHFANGTKGTITLNNSLYEKILEEIKQLNKYEYNCVEQTASKLKAMLYKNRIQKTLGIKENMNSEINQLISQLADYQNSDGSFGWWRKTYNNWRMTIYAIDVLQQANSEGFTNSSYIYARNILSSNIQNLSASDKLYALAVFGKMKYSNATFESAFNEIKTDYLSTTDKIYYYQILQAKGQQVSSSDLYSVFLEMNSKLAKPYYDNFFQDPRADVYTSYAIFKGTSLGEQWLKVFKKKLLNGQLENNLNTFARASMIEALSEHANLNNNKPIQSTVKINDTLTVKTFPFSTEIKGTNYTFNHKGGSVFVNSAEENWTYTPSIHDSMFSIKTSFSQKGNTVNAIKIGEPCIMHVDINAYRSGEYVMVEIPIPSGMQVKNKNQFNSTDFYMEYYKQKVVVFYNKVSMGKKQIDIEMQPIFSGEFMLPASKVCLMYYPFVYGNNENKTIVIK